MPARQRRIYIKLVVDGGGAILTETRFSLSLLSSVQSEWAGLVNVILIRLIY